MLNNYNNLKLIECKLLHTYRRGHELKSHSGLICKSKESNFMLFYIHFLLEVSHTIKIQNLDHLDNQKWSDFIYKNLFFFARVNHFLKWYMYCDLFLPLDIFRCTVSHRLPWKNKNAIYHLQISALVPEIFKDVRANCFCASLLRTRITCHVMPRHASSARAKY